MTSSIVGQQGGGHLSAACLGIGLEPGPAIDRRDSLPTTRTRSDRLPPGTCDDRFVNPYDERASKMDTCTLAAVASVLG
jgi:hypothetical protein